MAFDPVSAIFGVAGQVIERLWPDPTQKAEALQKLAALKQSGELAFLSADVQLLTGQIETNKIAAQHGGWFKGGWRPAVGWVCAVALAYKFVAMPFAVSMVQIIAFYMGAEKIFPVEMLPELDWPALSVILLGMLGIGTLRTYEKRKTAQN